MRLQSLNPVRSLARQDGASEGPTPTDETLMEQVFDRDYKALDKLYQRHHQRLENTIRQVIRDEAEVHDILQETLLQVWNEAAHFSAALGKPLGWMTTIAKRRAIDRARRHQAYARVKDRFQIFTTRDVRKVDAEIYNHDLRQFLQRQMDRLPVFQRQVIDLAYFQGLSQREIAAATQTSLGTIKTRLELAMRKLTQRVRPERAKV